MIQLAQAPSGAVAQEAEQRVQAARLEYAELERKIEELKKTNPNADSEVASLKERLASADSELESLQKQLIQKDKIIADKTKQIEQQKTNIAALQMQIDEIKNSPDRSAAQVAILRDEIAAQNSKIKDLEDPLLEKELRTQLGSMSNELDLVCESFAECMSRGQRAFHSNDFSAALGFFRQAEIISPESPLSWHWVGHASMAAGRTEEAYAAWDRILALHGGIPLTACDEVGQPMCEGGTLTISAGSLARYKGDNKVFEVPPQFRPRSQRRHPAFRLAHHLRSSDQRSRACLRFLPHGIQLPVEEFGDLSRGRAEHTSENRRVCGPNNSAIERR